MPGLCLIFHFWSRFLLPVICNVITGSISTISTTWVGSFLSFTWNWTGGWLSWTGTSDAMLRNVEKQILSCVKTAYKRFYVDIGSVVGQSDKIWTISLNDESPKTPLVMMHGFASGVALWCPNLDAFAATRPVYAFDLLGFGRSSRPKFATDAEKVEAQWVESVEEWRREVNISQFILLGHSLGGYIATSYAMKYPERVRHLILADPWGFPERPENVNEMYKVPFWVKAVAKVISPFNPLWMLRAAGPAGRWLVSKARPDLPKKYQSYLPDAENLIPDYLHQCNAQTPSGETAFFHSLMAGFAWAKNPMVNRLHNLDSAIPVTVLYGGRSWVDNSAAQVLIDKRDASAKTYIQIINAAGHHVYLDKPELFNKHVLEACEKADAFDPLPLIEKRKAEVEQTEKEASEAKLSPQEVKTEQDTNADAKKNS